ncbi:MAG: hypothetical protein LC624_00240 [Halobacteriales archaeon]|nr:hypothetical protein [Halobacteriales archaeon]
MRPLLALALLALLAPAAMAGVAPKPVLNVLGNQVAASILGGFSPPVVYIPVGGSVSWEVHEEIEHTAVSILDGSLDLDLRPHIVYTVTFPEKVQGPGHACRPEACPMRALLVLAVLALAAPLALAAQAPAPVAAVQVPSAVLMDLVTGFAPAVTVVPVGGSVTWTSVDFTLQHHTASGDSGQFDTGHVVPGQSVSVNFPTAGVITYHCQIHFWMRGVVVVN